MNEEKRHTNQNDKDLQGKISSFMRASADIEDVMNDPALCCTRDSVRVMVSNYNKTVAEKRSSRENEKYIKESLSYSGKESSSENYSAELKDLTDFKDFKDFTNSDISMLTADWVKEWHRQKQMAGNPDPKAEERKDFIASSLDAKPAEIHEEAKAERKKTISRSVFIRYVSLSAAAVIGAVILISTLLPSSPDRIFNTYYEPFDAISPVTRNTSNSAEEIYANAINCYKSGDYRSAATGFAEANVKNPSSGAPLFYMGLTSIELGNISEAVNELSAVVTGSGEYVKDAMWYLGLAYLKSGDKAKASECFKKLSESPGYYHDRSEELLRSRNLK